MLPYNIVCVGLSAASTFYLFYDAWLGDHMYSCKEESVSKFIFRDLEKTIEWIVKRENLFGEF